MKRKITMLTAVPSSLAQQLIQNKRISDYNTMPSLNIDVLKIIRRLMVEQIGYDELPMACLSCIQSHDTDSSGEQIDISSIFTYIPVNTKKSVIFQLEMPEDMLLSISLSKLLAISADANLVDMSNPDEASFIRDRLEDEMILGYDESINDPISFIPFLAFDKCKFYAKLGDDMNISDLDAAGIHGTDLRELSSFVN